MAVTVSTRPQFLKVRTRTYGAWDLRQMLESPPGEGVAGYEDWRAVQRVLGANMSVDIGSGSRLMTGWVRGDTRQGQGLYRVDTIDYGSPTTETFIAQVNHPIASNASGNPRIDQVILAVGDSDHSGGKNEAFVDVIAGTPTAGATLDNRSGAATVPASALLLADVVVASGAASIVTANIRDRRLFPLRGVVPPLLTDQVFAQLTPVNAALQTPGGTISSVDSGKQSVALHYLPTRVVANQIRWRYLQGPTAAPGNYVFAFYDASGYFIASTAATGFTGLAGAYQNPTINLTSTATFEAGAIYVLYGIALTGTGTALTAGTMAGISAAGSVGTFNGSPGPNAPNMILVSTGLGVTVPTNLLAFTDQFGAGVAVSYPPVPSVTLSVA